MRVWPLLVSLSVAPLVLFACVGDDASSPPVTASNDGEAGATQDGSVASGDGAVGNDASTSGDAAGDAATVRCGYAGEECCVGPLAACNDGTTCSAAKECVVSDVWAVGDYVDISTFKHNGVSSHFNGSVWEAGPDMGTDSTPNAVWGLAPGEYRAVTDKGKILLLSTAPNARWLVCGSFGCSDPKTTKALYGIFGFSSSDFWVGGSNSMYQCDGTNCVAKTSGLPASWGQGNLTGTSSSDLWYSAFDKAFHYDGAKWTTHPGIQARAMWAHTANDVWAGDTTLQHFDGTTWSPKYTVSGSPAPGIITGMSGTAADDVWAVGYNPSDGAHPAFSAHWDGTAWTLKPMPATTGQVQGVWAASKKEAFAVSFDGGIFKWDGTAWTAMKLATKADGGAIPASWNAVYGSARPRPAL